MNSQFLVQASIYVLVLTVMAMGLGKLIAIAYGDRRLQYSGIGGAGIGGARKVGFGILEGLYILILRLAGKDVKREMRWQEYSLCFILFNLVGAIPVYLLQRLQDGLPLNPGNMIPVSPDSAFNTTISFITNTNWQGYGGEMTMSYLTQMGGLAVQNFLSAASGIAVLIALVRGFTRTTASTIGNFWDDAIRAVVFVLLPLSVVLSIALVSQGVVQNFGSPVEISPLDQATTSTASSAIAVGPVASQVAIKQLGTNGGGFFNTNSAHPLENPTPLTNFLELLAILLIPAALCFTFGILVQRPREGWVLYGTMLFLFLLALVPCAIFEQRGNPNFGDKVDGLTSPAQAGGNMEGKEVRFGIASSVIWAIATTAASNGSVNSMHDSYTALGGLFPMVMMQLGEVVFGGVGSGLYGMIAFVILAVFLAGLMVGRTPEYLGKKIGIFEIKMVALVILTPCALTLIGTAIGVGLPMFASSISNPGPHGLSQMLYAYSSMGNNNGSAFAGLSANVPSHNYLGGIIMFISRYWLAIPTLALAGSLAKKKITPTSLGTLPTGNLLFGVMLAGVVLIVGALTFFPALALGPIAEHLQSIN